MPSPFITSSRKLFVPGIEKMKNEHPIVLIEPPGFGENSDVKMDRSMMSAKTYISFIEDFMNHTYENDFEK